jgi:putative chitinase
MTFTLKILQDTFIKLQPIESSQLPANQICKVTVTAKPIPVISWANAANNHISFNVTEKDIYYAYIPHVSLTDESGVDVVQQLVTADQFYAIAPYTAISKLAPLVAPLNIALAKYNITTPLRKAHFLAQTYHESDQFNTTEEYASGADYEWRDDLGNTQEGDGIRFKGRSLICVTGRANYKACGDAIGVDFVSNPELLASPDYAWLGACWFWDTHNLNNLADSDRFRDITIAINGGINGIDSRLEALNRAKQVFGI